MLAKFTLRWKFYRTAAFICNAPYYDSVCEVVNPSKDQELKEVASRHQIDPVEFKELVASCDKYGLFSHRRHASGDDQTQS